MSKSPPPQQPPLNNNPTKRLGKPTNIWQIGRPKPKRLRLTTISDGNEHENSGVAHVANDNASDIFELNHDRFVQDVYFKRNVRPLPAISTMLALAPQQRGGDRFSSDSRKEEANSISNIPILGKFMNSLREVIPNSNLITSQVDSKDGPKSNEGDESDHNCDDIFHQVSSVVTNGHHKRFRAMLEELEKDGLLPDDKLRKRKAFSNSRLRKKEFQKLCELFQEERRLYAVALERFKVNNANKFLTGFRIPGPASTFVKVKSKNYAKWKSQWQSALEANIVSNHYGPYTQAISLQPNSKKQFETIGLNTFQPKILHRNIDVLPKLKSNWRELALQQRKLKASFISDPSSIFISQDEKAMSLAQEYKADIVLTSQTLETLLMDPTSFNANWSIPISYINVGEEDSPMLALFVENPLPTILTPRECLSVGTQEALRSHVIQSADQTTTASKGEYVYTMLTIARADGNQKILVRSCNCMINENSNPTLIFSKLEYFSQHGEEKYIAHERAIWLLHKILQPDCEIIVGRVDVTTMHLLGVESKSVAEALTLSDPSISEKNLDTLGCFEDGDFTLHNLLALYDNMVNVLSSVSLVAKKTHVNHMLCFPGRSDNKVLSSSLNVTVHSNQNLNNIVVDVEKELEENATAVSLNESSLRSCFRSWEWEHNRLPYTFPCNDFTIQI